MKYENFQTFDVKVENSIATVTFNFGSVNVQGQEMLADLNSLAMRLERDRDTKVVIFQSANPEVWVCHYDTELLKDMATEAVSREDAELLDLQCTPTVLFLRFSSLFPFCNPTTSRTMRR